VDGVDRDDIGVPEASERVRLPAGVSRNLEDDRPVGQVLLACQIHSRERPPADLLLEPESEEHRPDRRTLI
jgi:hypothetical protein